ncbi:Pilus assembly protein [Vibrio chagasii]|uniref:TadE/TadG family type IV pilus assembly protein n=1 Tax=Vibrio chagasii TaxID=170679 RepID=UPI001EFE36B5|nr:TadE family protein [Vibrio chagasii]MDE9380813.1 pilus assembly protein [Vibrio alginolyticus]MCG9566103.1 pilus assembly protein [Vibrio chagasii]MCG9605204.1 pilus assembly protein [Vibrio chagasii]MCG9672802.1 pilus assembly protein [Vibrio chagasii]CAH6804883.1 Pilus assembly protein [Vibrio chagasii]
MLSRQKGANSVEFLMITLPFLLLIIGVFEICRLLLVSIIFDVAVHAGAREVKIRPVGPIANQVFIDTIDKFPLLDRSKIKLSQPLYVENLPDLVNRKAAPISKAVLGEYTVSYAFSFALLPSLSTQFLERIGKMTTLEKKVLVSYDG